MSGPRAKTASDLAQEVHIAQSTLSSWLRKADTIGRMAHTPGDDSHEKTPAGPTAARSAEDKLRILTVAASLQDDALGALLRREGVLQAQLDQWRAEVLAALTDPRTHNAQLLAERRRVQVLERELDRKEKALAEAAALLVLGKKVRSLLGDEDDSTPPRSGR
jgi:hypothetical protein